MARIERIKAAPAPAPTASVTVATLPEDDAKATARAALVAEIEVLQNKRAALGDPIGERRERQKQLTAMKAKADEQAKATAKAISKLAGEARAAFEGEQARLEAIRLIDIDIQTRTAQLTT